MDAFRIMQEPPPPAGALAPVSVVIPCYRCADTIGDAVASVAGQSLRPAEVILVDDASGDATLPTLQKLAAEYATGWIKVVALTRNGGPSRARNAGWELAGQEYIAFLDADDTWAPEKIGLQVAAVRADPSIALISHRIELRERGQPAPGVKPPIKVRPMHRRRLLLNNPFPTPTVMLRRDLPFRFDENFRRVEDFLLWAQIAFSGHRCAMINQSLASLHKPSYGVGGLSGDVAAMHRAGREVRRELLRQGLVSRPEHYFARTIGTLRKLRRRALLAIRNARQGRAHDRAAIR